MSAVLHLAAGFALLLAAWAGVPLSAGWVTIAICAALLVLGLPHGSFDLMLILDARRDGWSAVGGVLLLYLASGAVMALLWRLSPTLALALFLLIGVAHFAEDWARAGSGFVAQGIGLATVTAPTLLHPREIADLLATVATARGGALIGAGMMMAAPAAVVVASVGLMTVARGGARAEAVSGLVSLAGSVLLPPLAGFALFFCLLHSPLHFAHARRASGLETWRQWTPVVVPTTLLALALAGAVYLFGAGTVLSAGVVRASFRTLSILTLPHVMVPVILRRWRARSGRSAPAPTGRAA